MKKILRDPDIYFILGVFGLVVSIPSDNLFVNIILIPVSFILLFIALFFTINKFYVEKRKDKQCEDNLADISIKKKLDISIFTTLLAAFSSLFAMVSSFVLLMFLKRELLDMIQYFIIATSCIQLFTLIIAFIIYFKIMSNRKKHQ